MNMDLKQAQSMLKMHRIHTSAVNFSCTGNLTGEPAVPADIKLTVNTSEKADSDMFRIELIFEVKKAEIYTLSFTLIGHFSIDGGLNGENGYMKNNAVAILFPYARSQITLLTTQPGITPVVLQPININALLKEQ